MTLPADNERPQLVFKDGMKEKKYFLERRHIKKKKDAPLRSSSQKSNAQKNNASKGKTKLMVNSAFD